MTFDVAQLFAYSPMLILIGMGCVILLAETFIQGKARSGLAWLGVAGCVAALVAIVAAWGDAATPTSHFDGMLTVDRMALYLDAAFVVAALLTLLFAPPYLREQGFEFGEFYALVLFATAGMVMVVARHQPGVAAHRHRDDVAGRLRPHRLRAPQPAQRRGGDEVLPHGRLRHRLPRLRHRAGLRRHRRRVHLLGDRRQDRAPPARCRSSTSASTSS